MTELNPHAVAAAPLLRALKANPDAKPSALAEAAGRRPNHIARDLAAGLIQGRALTPEGEAQLALIDRPAEAAAPAAAAPIDGMVGLLHAQIKTGPRNPRRDWESSEAKEALAELAASIKAEGRILQNLVVRPLDPERNWLDDPEGRLPLYELVAGERRWRAVRMLQEAGDWPYDRRLPALVADLDDAGHDRVALIENLKRRDLKPLEEARAFKALMEGDNGLTTEKLADLVNCTQRLIQQRVQLLKLSDKDQLRLERGELTIESARYIVQDHERQERQAEERKLKGKELLLMAELVDKLDKEPAKLDGWYYGSQPTEIRFDATGKALQTLQKRNFIDITSGWRSDARTYARLGYSVSKKDIARQVPGFSGSKRAEALRKLRIEVLGEAAAEIKGYATEWLNGPFPLDPKLEEAALKAKAEADALQAKVEEQRRRHQDALDLAQVLSAAPASASGARLVDVGQAIGLDLPWRLDKLGNVVTANGKDVRRVNWNPQNVLEPGVLALHHMIIAGVNGLAGLTTEDA